jgi:hypothetical protein
MKGAVREAQSAYHTRQSQDDHGRCLPLGSISLWSACAHCPTLCPLRATSPGAGLPGIGIVSDTARKNGWHLAEHAREARPDDEVGGQRGTIHSLDLPRVANEVSWRYHRMAL